MLGHQDLAGEKRIYRLQPEAWGKSGGKDLKRHSGTLRRMGLGSGTQEPSFFTLCTYTLLNIDTKERYYFVV